MTTPTLLASLQTTTMLEIDGLHAWEFSVGDAGLVIEAVDGRDRKMWKFTPAQVDAATFDPQLQSWVLSDDKGDHRLVCLDAFSPSDDEDDVEEAPEHD
ncbi:DUF5629 family protein [Pseudomonas sp. NA-150]|uniref:DUF5629 family protein n=1 Tax=Pseudomonas sp. NA-150 TaxID=3367525 RepID=UPI0037CB96BA